MGDGNGDGLGNSRGFSGRGFDGEIRLGGCRGDTPAGARFAGPCRAPVARQRGGRAAAAAHTTDSGPDARADGSHDNGSARATGGTPSGAAPQVNAKVGL
jgi:hypothetical protein